MSLQGSQTDELLGGLNDEQRQAVQTTDGPLLIVAGAGSGKTRVLTHRVAYLLRDKRVTPWNILAITFTNKAAREMKERISAMVGPEAEDIWISTFHAMCVRILRRDIERIGYSSNFTILDADDQLTVIKQVLQEYNIDPKKFDPKAIRAQISGAKNLLAKPEIYKEKASDLFEKTVADVYEAYEKKLRTNHALDFDDLIMVTLDLFARVPDVRQYYQRKFQYIHVDEYQDTNHAQYELVKQLAAHHQNICVVGDSDQSIYGWRGADIKNILSFEQDYPQATVIQLEQNYRSTETILEAANHIIAHNTERKAKNLWTNRGKGEAIQAFVGDDEYDEAYYVVDRIVAGHKRGRKYQDFAILYRTNAQSRAVEETLVKANIPYRIVGGIRFYERKEVKDVLAYLRLVANPDDDLSLTRVINVPKRGLGKKTVEKLAEYAAQHGMSMFQAMAEAEQIGLQKRFVGTLHTFRQMIAELAAMANYLSVTELMQEVLERTEYRLKLQREGTIDATTRLENVDELISVAQNFEQHSEDRSLVAFLTELALVADVDMIDEERREDALTDDAVILMTLHSAKGLEFPVVFLIGMEEGIFPHIRSLDEAHEMEEERRLAYVGITRAQKQLHVARAQSRTLYGSTKNNPPSRFLSEIPAELIQEVGDDASETPSRKSRLKPRRIQTPTVPPGEWRAGDQVNHQNFGRGTIVAVKGEGDNVELDIAFPAPVGVRRFLASFAPLEKV